MGVVAAVAAVGLGALVAAPLRRRPDALAGVQRWSRRLAAAIATLYWAVFTAGVVGAVAGGDTNPVLPTLALGLAAAALLLWRGPARTYGIAGHWLAALWILYSAWVGRHSPAASGLFVAVALPALFAATAESFRGFTR